MADGRPRPRGSANVSAFASSYASAFRVFLVDQNERSLRAAYELGRDAVAREVGLLELGRAHHAALEVEIARATESSTSLRIAAAASEFFLEALSAYEMVRRGFAEVRETLAIERQEAAMIRQLSTLLADTSLALQERSSVGEMLQLVAEQARQLTGASWCVMQAREEVGNRSSNVAHTGVAQADADRILEIAYRAIESVEPATAVVELDAQPLRGAAMATPLAALDGEPVGLLAIGARGSHSFNELDRAVLIHIGQMAAAALERTLRYPSALS